MPEQPHTDVDVPHRGDELALSIVLAAAAIGLLWVVLPFYGAILWAIVIVLLFAPVHRKLRHRLPGRPNAAALVTMLAVVLVVVLPCLAVISMLALEASSLLQDLQSGELAPLATLQGWYASMPGWARRWLLGMGLGDFAALQERLLADLTAGSQFIATRVFNLGQDTFIWMAKLFVALYLAFFLLRDGAAAVRWLRGLVPLSHAHQSSLARRFGAVVRATVRGTLVVAALQGALGGLAFWVLDVRGAVLWGVLMAFLSLLPAVGSALVWAPVAAMLFFGGEVWQAAVLVAWGVLVIGLVDNILRPMLVGRETGLPDSLVMLSTLGGLTLFGLNGFVIGPAMAALFMAAAELRAGPRPEAPDGA
ncbi:MAG: AI-2E family transporter [Rubrivivax sp.]|nr:AI-2E family transporter [Rubrivivax sp.]MDP3223963.1 AI-2E family transporter [Rubrivivax sp.]